MDRLESTPPLTRAGALLVMVRQGLRDMEGSDHDRVLFGFCGVVVFGRSATLAMQHLARFDREAFDTWYAPWKKEVAADPLIQYFNRLRNRIVHGIDPPIAVVLSVYGRSDIRPGSVTIDWPPPPSHRGVPITDVSMENLCRIYLAYLEQVFESFAKVVWEVFDRLNVPKEP